MSSDRSIVAFCRAFCAACFIGAALTGCGGKNYQPPPPADPALARTSLEKALDAWRLRITPEELLKAEPAITVADPDWRSGHRLVEFQLQPGEQTLGTSIYWPVRLRVVQANGYEQWLDVTYIISTNPIIHISRQD
jgi:hypothetical protein